MCTSIKEFDFYIPVIAKNDWLLMAIYASKLLKKLGLLLIANWADWDEDLPKLEMGDLLVLNFNLILTVFDFDEIQKLLHSDIDLDEPAETDAVDPADNIPVIIDDLWILGEHWLYCDRS